LIGDYANGNLFLDALKNSSATDNMIALVDLKMPGLNGIELTRVLQMEYPQVKTIVLSLYDTPIFVVKAIEAKAVAYLNKGSSWGEILATIEEVHQAGYYYSDATLKIIQDYNSNSDNKKNGSMLELEKISKREKEILQLICSEYSSAEIAELLYIELRTVENHRNHLLIKTGCRNTAGLVLFAIQHNLFTPVTK
jgi:DNA-binding NarL/FixJ family response regulator